jgi:hypothetical protein
MSIQLTEIPLNEIDLEKGNETDQQKIRTLSNRTISRLNNLKLLKN